MSAGLHRFVWILFVVLFELFDRLYPLQAHQRYEGASGAGLSRLVTRNSV